MQFVRYAHRTGVPPAADQRRYVFKSNQMLKPIILEHNITIAAPAEIVFARYKDVERWSDWDPATASSTLDGKFEVGTRGRLVPNKGLGVPMELTEVIEGSSFTIVSKIPMFLMQFNHEIEPNTNGVKVTHRVKLQGLLLMLIGNRLASQIDKGLPITLTNLKVLAERRDVETISVL